MHAAAWWRALTTSAPHTTSWIRGASRHRLVSFCLYAQRRKASAARRQESAAGNDHPAAGRRRWGHAEKKHRTIAGEVELYGIRGGTDAAPSRP